MMTCHLFQTQATTEQKRRLEALFDENAAASRRAFDRSGDEGRLTPAVLEQMAGEHEKVDDFLDALEGLPEAMREQSEKMR